MAKNLVKLVDNCGFTQFAVSERELLLAMQLLLSMGIAAYNSGLSISLAELHSLESDICELQSQMISL